MGGVGSGRKPDPVNQILREQNVIARNIGGDTYALPNLSGVKKHSEERGTFVKKTGDTMTGDLLLSGANLDITHTATQADEHAVELIHDAAGFGDSKAMEVVYTTGAIATGQDEPVFLVNIDESSATGGDVAALEVLATEGSANIFAVECGALVSPLEQLSGTFSNMTSALSNTTDVLADFISTGSNVEIFSNSNDTVTIGNLTKFEEIEFLLATAASGGGISPTFEFSTAGDTWTTFTPVDSTSGLRFNGVIAWLDSDIPTWATHTDSEYKIRITRNRNVLTTAPVESKVQIAATTEYKWDKNGDIVNRDITGRNTTHTGTATISSMSSAGFVKNDSGGVLSGGNSVDISSDTNLVAGTNITLSGDTLNVDDAFLLNTGDTSTGDLTMSTDKKIIFRDADIFIQSGADGELDLDADDQVNMNSPTFSIKDASSILLGTTTGTKIGTATNQKLGFYNTTPVTQPTALTTAETQISHSNPGTADYTVAYSSSAFGGVFGFTTRDKARTFAQVVLNLQTRVDELEDKLQALGLLA